jgi:ArsR family transcriptional regulator
VITLTSDVGTVLEVLGNESRRKILSLLSKKPCYVSEISYALKMAPKAVLEHLEKLERAGLINSYEDGRRRYFYIYKNLRLEISITPHTFQTNLLQQEIDDLDKTLKDAFRLFQDIRSSTSKVMKDTVTEIYRNLKDMEEIQKKFSLIQGYIASRASEIFDHFLDEVERCIEDEYERIALLGLSKGATKVSEIAEEFGLPYLEVKKAIEKLKKKGVVEEINKNDSIEFIIKCR